MSDWSGLRSLASTTLWTLGLHWDSLGYLIVASCHGDLTVLDLLVWPLHILQQFIDEVGMGEGYLIVLALDLDGSWVGYHAAVLHCHPPGELFSTALFHSPNAAGSKEQGQVFCSHHTTLTPSGPALLFCPDEV